MKSVLCKKYLFPRLVFVLLITSYCFSVNKNPPAFIVVHSINPHLIWVKNAGGVDSSIIMFEVRDSLGDPVSSGVVIKFSLTRFRSDGDQYIVPLTAISDTNGRVSTILHSGFLGDASLIRASIDSTLIKSAPANIFILLPTEVKGNDQQNLRDFALLQNFPNPFNPSTSISYFVPVKSRVSLEVLNILGERIALLDEGEKDSGLKTILWNAKVSSGIYFYRLNTSRGNFYRKMLLIK